MSLLIRRSHAWLAGIMLKVTGRVVMAGAFTLWPATVLAAGGDGKKQAAPLKRDDLSLYRAPRQAKTASEEPEAGQLEKSVANLRKVVEPYTAWCRTTYGQLEPKVQSVVQCGRDTLTFLKDPPGDVLARAGIIGFTGVLGLLFARRSRVKKLIYPAGLMAATASMYYPDRAAAIAKSTGDTLYDGAVHSYAAVEKLLKPTKKAEGGSDSTGKS
ncbi:MICOS complex subunit MIC26-like [Dunckerocampus dactyliophorus]|uniref:MICOS complex subunit MIC26-like n=1 Tax=Dunckerocampus dactyliophorus TaxID=161453 RepID=UPI0024054C9F|nr:MICOS complex subunit MIC26-like [Dunckerocampus dactyliophorus]